MQSLFAQKIIIVGVLSLLLGFKSSVEARPLRCSDNPVAFDFKNSEGLECLCEAVKRAINFLNALGLPTKEPFMIKLTDNLPISGTFGTYDPKNKEIQILTYSEAKKSLAERGLDSDLELSMGLWCSFAVHELVHAIINENCMETTPSRLAQEYIACVTQLMVMGFDNLEIFLNDFGDVEGFSSIREMSVTYYLLDPQRFAVKCYRHYLSLKNPAQFVARLLTCSPKWTNRSAN